MIARAVLLWTFCFLFACGCSGSLETRTRTALEVLHDVIDPAYNFADQACTAREREAVERYEAPPHPAQAKADYLAIKARCVETRRVFREMREAHDRAAHLLEEGQVRQAELEIERVREAWRAFEERKPP